MQGPDEVVRLERSVTARSQYFRDELHLNMYLNLQEQQSDRYIYHPRKRTILSIPRRMLHKTLLNHSPPLIGSSGSLTNSVNGFSSRVNVKYGCCGCCCCCCCGDAASCPVGVLECDELTAAAACCVECTTIGMTFKNDLRPIQMCPLHPPCNLFGMGETDV